MASSTIMRVVCMCMCMSASLMMMFLQAAQSAGAPGRVSHHGGRLLTGNVNIGILWYGKLPPKQRTAILDLVASLNDSPGVSQWWSMVESYQSLAKGGGRIGVRVVSETSDQSLSLGKVLIKDFIKELVPKATGGKPNMLALIVAEKGVSVQDMCSGSCAQHGVIGEQPYVALGDPESECPECAWPFLADHARPLKTPVRPPSGDVGADTMVRLLASGLAGAVTNPYGDGIYAIGHGGDQLDATNICSSSTTPGNLLTGVNGARFLLPALWNPKTSACWTP